MPNKNTHQMLAAFAAGTFSLVNEQSDKQVIEKALLNMSISTLATSLPDLLEPATSPHHRQIFHSLMFGGIVVYAGCKLYEWRPEERWERVARNLLLVGCGSYLLHLLADSFTPRGLPLVGRV